MGAAFVTTMLPAIGAFFGDELEAGAQQAGSQSGANAPGIRRIVTGNNARGRSYVVSDTRITGGRAPNVFQTTSDHPMGPGSPGDPLTYLASTMTQLDLPPGACSSNYVYMAPAKPDTKPLWHRTMTIDYNFLISGELVLMLEEGSEVVLSGPGDVVIQRNTNHAWRNNSSTNPCIFVAVLVHLPGKA
jgi:hypothetical protein